MSPGRGWAPRGPMGAASCRPASARPGTDEAGRGAGPSSRPSRVRSTKARSTPSASRSADLVGRERLAVVALAGRLAPAEAAQVRGEQAGVGAKARDHPAPHVPVLRPAVKEKDRRLPGILRARFGDVHADAVRVHESVLDALDLGDFARHRLHFRPGPRAAHEEIERRLSRWRRSGSRARGRGCSWRWTCPGPRAPGSSPGSVTHWGIRRCGRSTPRRFT